MDRSEYLKELEDGITRIKLIVENDKGNIKDIRDDMKILMKSMETLTAYNIKTSEAFDEFKQYVVVKLEGLRKDLETTKRGTNRILMEVMKIAGGIGIGGVMVGIIMKFM